MDCSLLDTGLNCVTIYQVENGFGATVEPPITAIHVTGRKATRTVSRKATVNINGWHVGNLHDFCLPIFTN